MKLPRRQFLHLAAGAAALPVFPRVARAQAYPSRPVRIIVGFAPGQAIDIVTRMIGQRLSERLGEQFIIDNRPGAARCHPSAGQMMGPRAGEDRRGWMASVSGRCD